MILLNVNHVQGRSLQTGEILTKVYMYRTTKNDDDTFDTLVEAMIVTEGDQSNDVKARLRDQLGQDFNLPWDRVRIREKIDGRLGTVMKQGRSLKQTINAIRDGVELALQVVEVRLWTLFLQK